MHRFSSRVFSSSKQFVSPSLLGDFPILYRPDHTWINLQTGGVGVTSTFLKHHQVQNTHSVLYQGVNSSKYRVEFNQDLGTLYVPGVTYTFLTSPVIGKISSKEDILTNVRDLPNRTLFNITEVEQFPDDLMDYHDYMSYIMSLRY